jgi:hypothetical protein
MFKRYVHAVQTLRLPLDEDGISATLGAWRETLGPRQTRRMSDLGLLLAGTLRDEDFADDPALVYATTYTETRALERFIESFPYPSPLHFQMSIHPGGAEQAMILRQQPVTEFYPIAGLDHLLSEALKVAFTVGRPRAVVFGGEERGTWLLERKEASAHTFAWKISLSEEPTDALAEVIWAPDAAHPAKPLHHLDFYENLDRRVSFSWGDPAFGQFRWIWK